MISMANTISNNEYWNKVSYNPSAYFNEFSVNLVNDVLTTNSDCFDPFHTIIKEEKEEILSPSSFEVKNSDYYFFDNINYVFFSLDRSRSITSIINK
jgi:hypothetical protein